MPERELLLMIGLQGSGKSTYVNEHLAHWFQVLCLDDIRLALGVDYSHRLEPVVRSTTDIMGRAYMERGLPLVIDGINTSIYIIKKYIALAREYKYLTSGIYMNIPSTICRARRIGTKKITEKVMDRAEQNLDELVTQGGFYLFDRFTWLHWDAGNNTWNAEETKVPTDEEVEAIYA